MASLTFPSLATVLTSTESIDLISDESLYYIRLTLGFVTQFIVLTFGLCTNIVNMIVFIKIDIKNTVTFSFFALSIAHFGCILFYIVGRAFLVMESVFNVQSCIHLGNLSYLIVHYNFMFKDVADWIIVFIAVQKCCCVAVPFHFKNTFTYARSVATIVAMYLVALAYYLPVFTGQWLKSSVESSTNTTRLVYAYSPRILQLLRVSKILNGLVLPILSQSVVIFCFALLSMKLKDAVNFRTSISANKIIGKMDASFVFSYKNIKHAQTLHKPETLNKEGGNKPEKYPHSSPNSLKGKELKVVQAVYFTAILFVVSNIGIIPLKFVGVFIPEFQEIQGKKYFNTYVFVSTIQSLLDHVGAALHIFIYMKFNQKYRGKLNTLFCCNKANTEDRWK